MFQKEVAERIVASPGTHKYGRLAISAQSGYAVDIPLIVDRRQFTPSPKVDAAVARFFSLPKDGSSRPTYSCLSKLTERLFVRRNKMLASILRGHGVPLVPLSIGVNPGIRPTAMNVQDFHRICLWLQAEHPTFFR